MADYKKQNYKYYDYLEELKKSRKTNMYGAVGYLADKFNLHKDEARIILSEWMANYAELSKIRNW